MPGQISVLLLSIPLVIALATTGNQPSTLWFDQNIDHFNFQNNGTFPQRYLYNDEYYQSGGPLFFYTGNEGDIWEFYNNTGAMFELAQKFNALVVFAEHRYYGESLPYGAESWDRPNIGLLSVEQALADYASLIPVILSDLANPDVPVITFGGSYGGSLSAYMRMHYPQIVYASLAASAPILLYAEWTNPLLFFQVVTQDFADINLACPSIVRAGIAKILELGAAGEYETIATEMSLCSPPESMGDVTNLAFWLRNAYTFIAMLDYPYPTDFMGTLPGWPVNASCNLLLQYESVGLLPALTNSVALYYNGTGTLACYNITQEFFQCADPSGCGGARNDPDAMSWDYEACTEVIHDLGSNNITDMFYPAPYSIPALTAYCEQYWGVTPRPNWNPLNTPLQQSSRIIFSNGLLDPWHVGGVLESLHYDLPAIVIPEAAHHLDLRASNPADPPSVTAARIKESEILYDWIKDYPRLKGT